MAVERDSSYSSYAPADTKELVERLREEGIDIPNPVWTIGRRDERGQTNGNGKHASSNGNGQHPGKSASAGR